MLIYKPDHDHVGVIENRSTSDSSHFNRSRIKRLENRLERFSQFFKALQRSGNLPGSCFEGNEKEDPLSQSLRTTE